MASYLTSDEQQWGILAAAGGNLVSAKNSGFESGTGDWTAYTVGSSITTTTAWHAAGSHALNILCTGGSGQAGVKMFPVGWPPVRSLTAYALSAVGRAASTGRSNSLGVDWYDVSETVLLGSSTAATATDSSSADTTYLGTVLAPMGAGRANLWYNIGGSPPWPEVHYLDSVSLSVQPPPGLWTLTNCSSSTGPARGDSQSAQLTATATADMTVKLTRSIPVTAGKKYSVGTWGQRGTATGNVIVGIQWYDVTGAPLSQSLSTPAASGATWQPYSLRDVTAPGGAVTAAPLVTVVAPSGGQTFDLVDPRFFSTEPPWRMHNQPTDAWQYRRALGSLIQSEGVSGDSELQVVSRRSGADMSVDVLGGGAYIQGTDLETQGFYYVESDGPVNIPLTVADPTATRITSVFAKIVDPTFSSDPGPPTPNSWGLIAVDGPTPPETPPSTLRLADVTVAPKAKVITQGSITDRRVFVQTKGPQIYTLDGSGILVQANTGPWVQCNTQGWGRGWAFIPYAVPFPNKTISVLTTDTGPWNRDGKIRVVTLPGQARNGFWVAVTYDGAPYLGRAYLRYTAIGR